MNQGYLNLKKAAKYLDCSYSTITKKWVEWCDKYGIKAYRQPGARCVRFKVEDLDYLMEQWSVRQ